MEEANVSSIAGNGNRLTKSVNFNKRKQAKDPNSTLKTGVWIYFILLIFEGALRKWLLPALATPLLLVRDPIAVWLIVIAWKRGLLIFNSYINITCIVSAIAMFTAIFFGHGNLWVAIYGVRTLFLHFTLIFVIGNVFTREDVLKIGKFLVWLTLPMTVLLFMQFYSPQSAWVNRGVGGDMAGGGFSGALGFFRPPATFSFTNGTSLYYSMAACFILYFWFDTTSYVKKNLLILASIALLMSIPLSISRTLLFSVLITVAFLVFAFLKKQGSIKQLIIISIVLLGIFAILSQLQAFQIATDAFSSRYTNASTAEGGLQGTFLNRFAGGLIGAITNSNELPFWGYGLGMGTNVGSTLLTGKNQFLIAEGEWGRLVGELGIVMGVIIIMVRLSFTFKLALATFRKLSVDILPWILISFCIVTIPQAQWAQPTALGFSVFVAGLTIASMRIIKKSDTINFNNPRSAHIPTQTA